MKEQIYTIPVTDAFKLDCECPMCALENRLEDEYTDYVLGPFLMEPDGRMETNEKGFCQRHFEQLYNKQANRHGLALIIDTHLEEYNQRFTAAYKKSEEPIRRECETTLIKSLSNRITSKQTETIRFIDEMLKMLSDLEGSCTVCSKLEYTMGRYIDVIFYLWLKEKDFRELFLSKKGFCLKHFRQLLTDSKKYLHERELSAFTLSLLNMQLANMSRIREEVNWFTKKFDYRNNDAPWGNSKDAIPRSIQKIAGYCELK